MTDRPHIDIDPAVRNGEPCIAGTRLPALQMACEWIEGGWTFEELQYEYPTLTREGLLIACWYIAQEHPLSWRFWYQWHARAQEALAEGRYADVPLPPQKASEELA